MQVVKRLGWPSGPPPPGRPPARRGARPESAEGLSLSDRQVAGQGKQVWSFFFRHVRLPRDSSVSALRLVCVMVEFP